MRFLFSVFLFIGFVFVTQPVFAQSTCNPDIQQRQTQRLQALAQRSQSIIQASITRPDPVSQMVCLGDQIAAASNTVGQIFTDNSTFFNALKNSITMPTTLKDVSLTTLSTILGGGFSFGGGTLSITPPNLGSLISNIIPNFLPTFPSTCGFMDQIWNGAALRANAPDFVLSLADLEVGANNPLSIAGVPFTIPNVTSVFTAAATAAALSDMAGAGTFSPPSMQLGTFAPLSISGSCGAAIETLGGEAASCQPGCKVTGSPGSWSCVPM